MLKDKKYVITVEAYGNMRDRLDELDDALYMCGELSEEEGAEHDTLVDIMNNCRIVE